MMRPRNLQQVKEDVIWEMLSRNQTSKEIKPMTNLTNTTKGAYRVLKNSRVATKTTFASYEQARQWVRSKLRRSITNTGARHAVMWDSVSRNPPSISHFGYAIRKVA